MTKMCHKIHVKIFSTAIGQMYFTLWHTFALSCTDQSTPHHRLDYYTATAWWLKECKWDMRHWLSIYGSLNIDQDTY